MASLPILLTAAVIAWQDFRFHQLQLDGQISLATEAFAARFLEAAAGADRTLAAVAAVPGLTQLSRQDLSTYLAAAVNGSVTTTELAVLDPSGRVLGGSSPDLAGSDASSPILSPQTWLQMGPSGLLVSLVDRSGLHCKAFARPIYLSGSAAGFVALVEPPGALDGSAGHPEYLASERAWLIDAAGQAMPITAAAVVSPLPPAILQQLGVDPNAAPVLHVKDQTGIGYGTASLPGYLRLVVAIGFGADTASAHSTMLHRFALLWFVLAGGLAAVGLGAGIAILDPMHRLSDAVQLWRKGAAFDPQRIDQMPREVRDLALSFSQATSALNQQETELRDASAQQELLMQEIHHRVKNNLQIVASLLNLQASRIRQPDAKLEFQSARDRVRALATLHRHLYAQGELHTIRMRSFLTELCEQLFQAFDEVVGARITLDIEASDLDMSSDQAVPLALMVTEAVSNAVKYGFPGDRRGRIGVRLTRESDAATLMIEDDGIGIAAGRDTSGAERRQGIGLQLIRGLARQLGAKFSVEDHGGTRYVIEIALRRDRSGNTELGPDIEKS